MKIPKQLMIQNFKKNLEGNSGSDVIVHIINKKTYDLWVSIMVFCGT
jgi:hypothetical protein